MVDPFTIIAIISFAASYMQAKKAQRDAKKARDAAAGVLLTKDATNEPIPVIYGERRTGGLLVYMSTSGDEEHRRLHMAVVLGEGQIESISNIEIDDIPYTDDTNALETSGAEEINATMIPGTIFEPEGEKTTYYEAFRGTPTQAGGGSGIQIITLNMKTDPNGSEKAGHLVDVGEDVNFRLQGLAAVCIQAQWRKGTDNPYTGKPKISALVKGKRIYDPRKDSTSVAYDPSLGVATHRSDDVNTWEWSDNYALCIRDYMTNDIYGKGLTDDEIDDVAFGKAASDLDSFTVTQYSGGPSDQKLFRCNAVINTGEKVFDNVNTMLMNCRGFMPYINGRYSLKIDQKVTSEAEVTYLTENHIIGSISLLGVPKEDKFNQVIVTFPDASKGYEENNAIWPDPASDNLTSVNKSTGLPDGNTPSSGTHYTEAELSALWVNQDYEELVDEVTLEHVTDYYSARDLARIFCWRSRLGLRADITATSEALDVTPGDVVFVEHQTPGWTKAAATLGEGDGYFQVDELSLNTDGTVKLSLLEFRNSLYNYDPAVLQTTSNPVSLGGGYSYSTNPRLMVAEGQLQAAIGWSFAGTDHNWSFFNTITVLNSAYISTNATTTDPYFRSPTFAVSGEAAYLVTARVRRTAGTGWDGSIAYATDGGHAIDYLNYRKTLTDDPTITDEWVTVEWDMRYLTEGGTDWVDSTITQIELQLGASADDEFDIQSVTLGGVGDSITQITSENATVYIKDLAVDTLQLANNSVTVIEADTDSTGYTGDGTTYNSTASIDIELLDDDAPVLLWWSVEHGYSGSGAGWRYKIKRDGVEIDARTTTMVALNDFPSGQFIDTQIGRTEGTTYTYTFEWWGESSDISAGAVSLSGVAVAK